MELKTQFGKTLYENLNVNKELDIDRARQLAEAFAARHHLQKPRMENVGVLVAMFDQELDLEQYDRWIASFVDHGYDWPLILHKS